MKTTLRERLAKTEELLTEEKAKNAATEELRLLMNSNRNIAEIVKGAKLYKVVGPGGKSIHGGDWDWSLPKGVTPGEWAVCPKQPLCCVRGFHLTTDPYSWWRGEGCRLFIAEVDWSLPFSMEDNLLDVTTRDHKIAVQKCRLVRELTDAECARLGVLSSWHNNMDWADTSASLVKMSGGKLEAHNMEAYVQVSQTAAVRTSSRRVIAFDFATVYASYTANVVANGNAVVYATGISTVTANAQSTVFADDNATVIVRSRGAKVFVRDRAVALVEYDEEAMSGDGAVVRSKKAPGRVLHRNSGASRDINGERWKVIKNADDALTFTRR
jgi:hypothetical protein